jgi:2-oxo-4-hydroxy-4-carboxy-5-ureidoimidazoline decarboxylase
MGNEPAHGCSWVTSYDLPMAAVENKLARLNGASREEAARSLGACCAAPQWVDRMVAARPYPDRDTLLSHAAAQLAALDWGQLRTALDAHPRIGERIAGAGTEADWSREEQSGMRGAADETRAAMVAANQAYEQRFGHVFLIFASGCTDAEMLAAAHARLANQEEQERVVVRTELARIVALRLERMVGS